MCLLHTADVHLADPLDPTLAQQTFAAIIDVALREKVDLLLVAGDLFDNSRADGETIAWALAELRRLEMPALVLPGNHDALHARSIYHRVNLDRECPNVRLLAQEEGELVTFPSLGLTLWGRPTVDHTPAFRPLADVPQRSSPGWHVALAHGFYVPPGESTTRSSPVAAEEIAASGWDYVALGHIHIFQDVSQGQVRAVYPGSPVPWGHYPNGTGHVALVELDPMQGVSVRPVALFPGKNRRG